MSVHSRSSEWQLLVQSCWIVIGLTVLNQLIQNVIALYQIAESRLSNFTVGLANVPPIQLKPAIGNYDICIQYSGQPPRETFSVSCGPNTPAGRYLIIQIPENNFLVLYEVEVYYIRRKSNSMTKLNMLKRNIV